MVQNDTTMADNKNLPQQQTIATTPNATPATLMAAQDAAVNAAVAVLGFTANVVSVSVGPTFITYGNSVYAASTTISWIKNVIPS